jgi:hypothetical protein
MLKFNRKDRISTINALKHPYFNSLFNNEDLNINIDTIDSNLEKKAIKNGIKNEMYNTLKQIHNKKNKK